MYCALPGSDWAKVCDFLKGMVELGKIQIGLSYHVVFELLQKATPQYRDVWRTITRLWLMVNPCGAPRCELSHAEKSFSAGIRGAVQTEVMIVLQHSDR